MAVKSTQPIAKRLEVTKKLTNAQILTLRSAAFKMVEAPGSGLYVKPLACYGLLDNSAAAYTNIITAGGTNAWFGFRINTQIFASIVDDAQLGANITAGAPLPFDVLPGYDPGGMTAMFGTQGKWFFELEVKPYRDVTSNWGFVNYGVDVTPLDNQHLELWANNDGAVGDLTGGNAANSMTVTIEYKILRIP